MKKDLTEIIFVLDRSGSMSNLTEDTIGGFNSFIENQKKEAGEALVTTVLFDNKYEMLHDGVNIKDIKPLTNQEYYARGMTALLDAVGTAITDVGVRLNNTPEEERPSKVMMIIMTDGLENASKEYTKQQVKEMIERQTNTYSWQFIFLGANIDTVKEAESIGISSEFASDYGWSAQGVESTYQAINCMATEFRSTGEIDRDWNKTIKQEI